MRTLLLIYFSISCLIGFSLDYNRTDTYYNHLYEVNKEWKHHQSICPKGTIKFDSDLERISLHLKLVCKALVNQTPNNLFENQLKNRYALILELLDYANNSIFPENLFHQKRTPYFVDYKNVHCAVGYLMKQSGYEDLVIKIKKEHNYDYVKDIDTKGVLEWSVKQGFSIDELKWIQPAYPQNYFEPIGNGANNSINQLTNDFYRNQIILTGEFDSINNMPCLSIGVFKDEQFSCLGNGITGQINDVGATDSVFVCGEIINNNTSYPFAAFNNGWSFYNIPNRPNAIATSCFCSGGSTVLEICISSPSIPNRQEIWYLNNVGTWEKQAELNGIVNDIEPSGLGRIYAGVFDSVFIFNNNTITDTILTKNIIIKQNYQNNWYSDGNTSLPNEINTIEVVNSAVYFGGNCPNIGDVCMTKYLNNTLQPLLINGTHIGTNINSSGAKINSILFSYQSLKVAGDFYNYDFNSWGNNLIIYSDAYNSTSPYGATNASVKNVLSFNNRTYIAGDFTSNLGIEMNHIGRRIENNSTVNETDKGNDKINIYPNPAQHQINITTTHKSIDKIEVVNMLGKTILINENINNQTITIDISNLDKGIYFVVLSANNKKESMPFIKL